MSRSKNHITPPKLAERVLLWFLKDDLAEEVLGDLDEKFYHSIQHNSKGKASRNYWYQVFNYLRPFAFKFLRFKHSNKTTMIRHNFKVSYRQMLRNKGFSFINIGGLAMGMVVAMLIGLWVHDELSFNRYHDNYDNIVQVLRNEKDGDTRRTNSSLTTGMAALMTENFPDQMEEVFMVRARLQNRVIANNEKKFRETGVFMQANGPKVLGFEIISGTQQGLEEIQSIMLSKSFAQRLFGDEDPIGKTVKMDARVNLTVTGIYNDIPNNSKFTDAAYVARMVIVIGRDYMNTWENYNVDIYAKINPNVNLQELGNLITEAALPHFNDFAQESEMNLFLHPMKNWHLRSEFDDGFQVTSQQMKFTWLYAIIGAFVLILACINFMNLSTARSEKRAKEVGIRKTLGSIRKELIAQFYMESMLYSILAFSLSLVLLAALLPWFNETSGKSMEAPWGIANFWLISIGFVLLTALLAGSYPAVYLSSFKPVKALKGTFSTGSGASIPRKVLVVFQFTISITLIIGTITVNNQIQTAKNRPVGYSPKGMISLKPASPNFRKKAEVIKEEMMRSGMAQAIGTSDYPVISNLGWNGGFTWAGMDKSFTASFNTISFSHGYADAVGMEFIDGRDFSLELETDKNAIIINRSAMNAMKLDNPVGTVVNYAPNWKSAENYTIIGVVEDMVKNSPFGKTDQSIMFLNRSKPNYLYIRLNPNLSASESIPVIENIFDEHLPEAPFDFSFADEDYNKKFIAEERIGRQASFFSILAILISCLGLFGLASYIAEQRTKEIGIRKVLGASILNIWRLLSKEFALLVLISCIIAIPIARIVLNNWLDTYEIRTQLYWWIFALAGFGAFLITLITVSFQAIKAAITNPVKSLRSE
jgi:putative ABC transport system permease protein